MTYMSKEYDYDNPHRWKAKPAGTGKSRKVGRRGRGMRRAETARLKRGRRT